MGNELVRWRRSGRRLTSAAQLARLVSRVAVMASAVASVLTVFAAVGAPASRAELYATGTGLFELSGLWLVNPLNGQSIHVWNFPGVRLSSGGLAYVAATDQLYATGVEDATPETSRLFAIDRSTGQITSFPGVNGFIDLSGGGLAADPVTGDLYATGNYNDGIHAFQSSALFRLDKLTGAATLIGFGGGNCCGGDFAIQLNGLGFRNDGTLFANGYGTGPSFPDPNTSYLFTVDLLTGAATRIGPSGVVQDRSLKYGGLTFAPDGRLLSLGSLDGSSGALYSIAPATGAATSLAGSGLPFGGGPIHYGVDGGLVFAPEPGMDALIAVGSLGLASLVRRRCMRRQNGHLPDDFRH